MPKVKAVPRNAKKPPAERKKSISAGKKAAPAARRKAGTPRRSLPLAPKRTERTAAPAPAPAVPAPAPPGDAQSRVVASKFASIEAPPTRPLSRSTLPASYGESHLLLLVRDPQTLFAAWDMAPSMVEAFKARLGRRGFAVSTLTLRLTRAGGGATVVHLSKKVRSQYLKIEGGPSFVAEIGFTTPTGRFELVARSAPCFVPMGPVARQESIEAGRRAVLGYREAMAVARRGGLAPNPGSPRDIARSPINPRADGGASSAASADARVLGGASDLYRR